MMSRIYWTVIFLILASICFWVHSGLAIFLCVLGGLAASIYWFGRSRRIVSAAVSVVMMFLAYLFSVSPIFVLIVIPNIEHRIKNDALEDHWIDDFWESYGTPWAKISETEIGKQVLVPYHENWVSTLE